MQIMIAVLVAFFVQGMVSVNHPRLGAAFGFAITSAVLAYGLYLYSKGNTIVLIVLPLSRTMFIGFCIAWYIWDAVQFAKTRR